MYCHEVLYLNSRGNSLWNPNFIGGRRLDLGQKFSPIVGSGQSSGLPVSNEDTTQKLGASVGPAAPSQSHTPGQNATAATSTPLSSAASSPAKQTTPKTRGVYNFFSSGTAQKFSIFYLKASNTLSGSSNSFFLLQAGAILPTFNFTFFHLNQTRTRKIVALLIAAEGPYYSNLGGETPMDWQTAAGSDTSLWRHHRGIPDLSDTDSEVQAHQLSAVYENTLETDPAPQVTHVKPFPVQLIH